MTIGIIKRAVIALLVLGLLGQVALAKEKTEIRIMARDMIGNAELYEVLFEEFEAIRPDIELVWEIAIDDWTDKLTTMLIAGVAPDIFEAWSWWCVDWANNGLLLDLRPYVQRDLTPQDIRDIFPGDWEACFLRYGERKGEQYAMPRYTNVGVTYYNTHRLEEAGLVDIYTVAQRGGWNFDTFREYARKLTVHDYTADIRQYGAHIEIGSIERLTGLVASFGGRMFSFEPLAYALDEPPAVAALEFQQRLMYEDQVIPKRSDPGERKSFSSGAVGIHLEGSHAVPYRLDEIGDSFPWLLAPWPAGPGGAISWAAGDKYCVNRQTKDPNATWQVLKFLTSTEGAIAHARYAALAPCRRSAMREYLRLYPGINAQAHMETANTARVFEEGQIPESRRISDIIEGALGRIWDGAIAPKTAFMEVKNQVDNILAPFR